MEGARRGQQCATARDAAESAGGVVVEEVVVVVVGGGGGGGARRKEHWGSDEGSLAASAGDDRAGPRRRQANDPRLHTGTLPKPRCSRYKGSPTKQHKAVAVSRRSEGG
jgi:hypothetical protein